MFSGWVGSRIGGPASPQPHGHCVSSLRWSCPRLPLALWLRADTGRVRTMFSKLRGGMELGDVGLIRELLGSRLASYFGIATPEPAVVTVDAELVELHCRERIGTGEHGLRRRGRELAPTSQPGSAARSTGRLRADVAAGRECVRLRRLYSESRPAVRQDLFRPRQ